MLSSDESVSSSDWDVVLESLSLVRLRFFLLFFRLRKDREGRLEDVLVRRGLPESEEEGASWFAPDGCLAV